MSNASFNPINDLRRALIDEGACAAHGPIRQTESFEEAQLWNEAIQKCSEGNRLQHYRWFGANDLFFLLVYMLGCHFMDGRSGPTSPRNPKPAAWYFARCAEYQAEPLGCLDFWSRGAGKSTIGTFGANIQSIICDPNVTICILSHTKPIARGFLRQIKLELENNALLKAVYPDIFWQDPKKDSPKWSEDEGITVKRTANPKESTVEAYGLIDGQPTGKHFIILDYDDVIDEKAVNTPDQIDKATKAWELSLNLRATDPIRYRVKGTYYAVGDTYQVMIERGFGKLRERSIIKGDHSELLSDESIALMKQSMSPFTWASQILLDLKQANMERGFKQEWLRHWKVLPSIQSLNRYIMVDPGGKGEESTSFTAMVVIGLGADRHIYVLKIIKDRLSLTQRLNTLFQLHREFEPMNVLYERYSMQADVEAIKAKQQDENYRFKIQEVGASSGLQLSKDKRIEKLQPTFANGLIVLPPFGTIMHKMYDGKDMDMVDVFVKREFLGFPYSREKDVLDALARIHDPSVNLIYPRSYGSKAAAGQGWGQGDSSLQSWMAD